MNELIRKPPVPRTGKRRIHLTYVLPEVLEDNDIYVSLDIDSKNQVKLVVASGKTFFDPHGRDQVNTYTDYLGRRHTDEMYYEDLLKCLSEMGRLNNADVLVEDFLRQSLVHWRELRRMGTSIEKLTEGYRRAQGIWSGKKTYNPDISRD